MAKEQKSPQQKKALEFERDHFTFSKHVHTFRKEWPLKKALANRELRRNSDEPLSQTKTGMSEADVELTAGDVTASLVENSISRRRLQKQGTVAVGDKVKLKLKKRGETVGRRSNRNHQYDAVVESSVRTLSALKGTRLIEVLQRITTLVNGGDSIEWTRLYQSTDEMDRAVFFVERLNRGDAFYIDALRRNPELQASYQLWQKKAVCNLLKIHRTEMRKREQKVALKKKVKALRPRPKTD